MNNDDPTLDYPLGSFKCTYCGYIGYEDVLVTTGNGTMHEACADAAYPNQGDEFDPGIPKPGM